MEAVLGPLGSRRQMTLRNHQHSCDFLQLCPEAVRREQSQQFEGLSENCGCGMARSEEQFCRAVRTFVSHLFK